MIACEFDDAAGAGRIVLQPNRSGSWSTNVRIAATLTVLSSVIALGFAWQGMWPVLPFCLAEGAAVLACLYWCARRTHVQEVLTFSADSLLLERGIGRPSTRYLFQRYFTRFFVQPPDHPWRDKRIAVRCRNQEMEIGGFLNADEKDELVKVLREMIHRLDGTVTARPRQ